MLFAYAQSPGYLTDDDTVSGHTLPLNSGFINGFQINDQWATIFSLPGLCISQATYIFGYGKQLRALAKSKLFPTFLSWTFKDSCIPYMALLTGSLLGFVILLVLIKGLGMNYNSQPIDNLFNAALMGSYFTFMIMFVSYLVFTFQYANLTRNYKSPLGVYGAVVGMIGMSFMFSGLIGFNNDNFGGLIYFFIFIGVCSLYYYFHARKRQMFSQEEQDVLFEVYLMNGKRVMCYFTVVSFFNISFSSSSFQIANKKRKRNILLHHRKWNFLTHDDSPRSQNEAAAASPPPSFQLQPIRMKPFPQFPISFTPGTSQSNHSPPFRSFSPNGNHNVHRIVVRPKSDDENLDKHCSINTQTSAKTTTTTITTATHSIAKIYPISEEELNECV
jgi:hypothetical protein